MALLTYDWHPPDPSGAVNAYLSGVRLGNEQREAAAKLAADVLERERLRKRFEQQHALQMQQEARLAGAEKLRQAYQQQRLTNEAALNAPYSYHPSSPAASLVQPSPDLPTDPSTPPDTASQLLTMAPPMDAAPSMDLTSSSPASMSLTAPAPAARSLDAPANFTLGAANSLIAGKPASLADPEPQPELTPWDNGAPAPPAAAESASASGVNPSLMSFVKKLEGFKPNPYGDHRQTSIGYGTVARNGDRQIDEAEATRRLEQELSEHAANVDTLAANHDLQLSPAQRNALISFSYNVGIEPLSKVVSASKGDPQAMARQMLLYNKVTEGGQKVFSQGLANRRQQEATMLLNGDGGPATAPSGGIARQIVQPAANDVDSMAQQLSRLGVSKKLAEQTISRALLDQAKPARAGSSASSAAKPIVRQMADGTTRQYDAGTDSWNVIAKKTGPQTREDYMKENYPDGVTAVPEHGTYKRADNTEFFLNRTATGKISERAFDPERHPARLVDGTDGKKYAVDATGEPMQPLPDGVNLGKFVQPHYTNVKGVGSVMIDSAGEGHVIIPEGLSMPTKVQGEYMDAAKAVTVAKDKLDAQKELLRTKPGFFGGSQKSVDQAQAEFDAATKAAAVYVNTYPQLKAHALAAAGVPAGAPADDDKVSVISPDGKPGKIPRSQLEAALKAGYRQ